MGVDARILIKITNPADWQDADSLRNLSSQLTATIGHSHFFLRPQENRHALSFVIDDNGRYPEEYEELHGKPYDPNGQAMFGQDSSEDPWIAAKENEQFIEAHLWSRYYSEEYARGDWQIIFMTLMWCINNIPSSEVWYGGDSSGCLMELMTAERLMAITKFFLGEGNTSYWTNRKIGFHCEFCKCGVSDSGGGGNGSRKFFSCASCGSEWITQNRDNNIFVSKWGNEAKDDIYGEKLPFFLMSRQIEDGTRPLYPFNGVFRIKYEQPKALTSAAKLLE